jgi:hypothetical protein
VEIFKIVWLVARNVEAVLPIVNIASCMNNLAFVTKAKGGEAVYTVSFW